MATRTMAPQFDLSDHMTTSGLARACNEDRRFLEAGWVETPEALERLLLSTRFQETLPKLAPVGGRFLLATVVANTFACRIAERGAAKRVGSTKWHERTR